MRKINFANARHVLTEKEMKNVLGGSGGGCCAYSTNYASSNFTCMNTGGASGAEFMAGSNGWWACNTPEVKSTCGC